MSEEYICKADIFQKTYELEGDSDGYQRPSV